MKLATLFTAVAVLSVGAVLSVADDKKKETNVPAALNFKMKGLDGKEVNLADYSGKVVLIVNVASACGNTPQYAGLEKLHEKYHDKGLVVLGVPANEFGGQEPGTDLEIAEFCKSNYNVKFPMLSKVVVKGEGITPLYKHLTSKDTNPKYAGPVTWNFEKFLIGRNGEVAGRFKPGTKPESEEVVKAIEAELEKK